MAEKELPEVEIIVNKKETVQGKLSVFRTLDTEKSPMEVKIDGIAEFPDYIEEIEHLETERLVISDVLVYSEGFGSSEKNIAYHFIAGDLDVKK